MEAYNDLGKMVGKCYKERYLRKEYEEGRIDKETYLHPKATPSVSLKRNRNNNKVNNNYYANKTRNRK